MKIKSNEYIILRLQPSEYNISFLYQTFGMTQYIFFDPRFATSNIIRNYPESFNIDYYHKFREKCLKINNEVISFTINEFVFLARVVDFVSKSFVGKPKAKLIEVYVEDFPDQKVDFEEMEKIYLEKSERLFDTFKAKTTSKEVAEFVLNKLKWDID